MRLPIVLHSGSAEKIRYGTPTFVLKEFALVERRHGRAYDLSWNSDNQRRFGTNEWARLVVSGGNLNSVGVATKNEPVPGVAEYWRDSVPGIRLW
jgi:hypothetical protein